MRRIRAVALVTASLVWTMMVPLPSRANDDRDDRSKTATPIKYLVVIFDENNSF